MLSITVTQDTKTSQYAIVKAVNSKYEDKTKELLKEAAINQYINDLPCKKSIWLTLMFYVKVYSPELGPFQMADGNIWNNYTYMLIPYCINGTILDLILKARYNKIRLSVGLVRYLCLHLVKAVDFMHNKVRMSHGDIKLENIAIND